MYQFIPLCICDYLNKLLIETNVATDEGNIRNVYIYRITAVNEFDNPT